MLLSKLVGENKRMWLLDKFLKTAVKHGRLKVTGHDEKTYEYGTGDADQPPIHIRLTNKKAANHIARYPQMGAGEAFMWGWLKVEEPHDIRDLILFVTEQAGKPGDRSLKPKGKLRTAAQRLVAKADSINLRGKAKKNAEHTYNLTRELYERFLDEDRQYTMAYYREDPASTSLEKAQLDKKAHLADRKSVV